MEATEAVIVVATEVVIAEDGLNVASGDPKVVANLNVATERKGFNTHYTNKEAGKHYAFRLLC